MTNTSAAELRKIASEANVEINYEFDAPFCAISQEDVLALADEIETLRAALKVAQQSLLEFSHAQECGPSWYVRGTNGMYGQVSLWLRRGLEAVQGALGPYDDNGEFLKEKPAGEQQGVPTITRGVTTVSPDFKVMATPSQLPINRALVNARDFCIIPLLQGSVTVNNNSPDPVIITVDRAGMRP